MAAKKTLEAAVDYFAAHSHDAWRRQFHKANPKQRALPRMRMRGGKMVDINKPWKRLDPKAQAENRVAAYAAYAAIEKFPDDREKASDYVHKQWIKRNRTDRNQPKTLFKPYSALPEVEKDKDRAHIDRMKAALAAVRRKPAPKKALKKTPKKAAARALHLDQRAAARLQAAATRLSTALGVTVTAEALMAAGVEAVLAVCEAAAPALRRSGARAKKRR